MFVSSALQYFHLYLHVKAFTKDMLFYWPWSEINAVSRGKGNSGMLQFYLLIVNS